MLLVSQNIWTGFLVPISDLPSKLVLALFSVCYKITPALYIFPTFCLEKLTGGDLVSIREMI